MPNSTQNETHNVCNERLAREGGQARCCDCEPHEGCTLGDRVPEASKTIDTQNDWVKRFNDEFPCLMHFRPNKKSYGYSEVGNDVKAFIAKLLADARKEGYEKGYQDGIEGKESAYKYKKD